MATKISVTSEYGRLRKVCIGRADGFRLPLPEHEPLLSERIGDDPKIVGVPYPDRVIEEANQTLDDLIAALKAHDPEIEIVRSSVDAPENHNERVGNRGYSSRDIMMVVHDTLYLCPTIHQSRMTEAEDCYGHIIEELRRNGNKVVDLRTPEWWDIVKSPEKSLAAKDAETERGFLSEVRQMAKDLDVASGATEAEDDGSLVSATYFQNQIPEENTQAVTEQVPAFDAANILIPDSKHLIYLISFSGNFHGLVYLKRLMKENHGMEVIPVIGVYHGTHIDTTLAVLNKEKVLFAEDRISLDQTYNIMKRSGYTDKEKNYIGCSLDAMTDVGSFEEEQCLSSIWIGMNLMAVDDWTLVVEATQHKLIPKLESHGFKILPVKYPHSRSMGGGVHCTTLPLLRE